jgi:hypothetical protein
MLKDQTREWPHLVVLSAEVISVNAMNVQLRQELLSHTPTLIKKAWQYLPIVVYKSQEQMLNNKW